MKNNQSLPDWALDATFGIFVHWGPYSVPAWAEPTGAWGAVPPEKWFAHNAYAEWYANTIRITNSPAAEHQRSTYAGADYDDFLDLWKAENWDPDDWAKLFREAGADYVIPVTKHHDGVTLWDAPGTGDRNTVARGPKRDLLHPLADAVRAEGMRFGVYYSGGLDWAFTEHPPIQSMEDVDNLRPNGDDYARYAGAHVKDLIDRYRPSVIWNDINWPDAAKADGSLQQLIDDYKAIVPEGIVNDRWGSDIGDYLTSEYSHDLHNERGIGWEHNRGLGFSFGLNQIEDESLTLTARETARLWSDVVSRGGRLLLNVGPDASGVIPAVQRRALEGLSGWMTEVKPHTHDRRVVEQDVVDVRTEAGEAAWYRAWRSGDDLVVITENDTDSVTGAGGEPVLSFALPVEDKR